MTRHPTLISLSHDHQRILVAARRLRDGDAAFADFFAHELSPHLREEEESLFPLVAEHEEAEPLLSRALLDHQRLRALALDADTPSTLTAIADLLDDHVRFEERELFPLIERLASGGAAASAGPDGPVWGLASTDLNATLLSWSAGNGTDEHVNAERDVLVFVLDGSVSLAVDGDEHLLRAGEALIIDKGARRRLTAGEHGVRYLSVHLRRPPLQISRQGL